MFLLQGELVELQLPRYAACKVCLFHKSATASNTDSILAEPTKIWNEYSACWNNKHPR